MLRQIARKENKHFRKSPTLHSCATTPRVVRAPGLYINPKPQLTCGPLLGPRPCAVKSLTVQTRTSPKLRPNFNLRLQASAISTGVVACAAHGSGRVASEFQSCQVLMPFAVSNQKIKAQSHMAEHSFSSPRRMPRIACQWASPAILRGARTEQRKLLTCLALHPLQTWQHLTTTSLSGARCSTSTLGSQAQHLEHAFHWLSLPHGQKTGHCNHTPQQCRCKGQNQTQGEH